MLDTKNITIVVILLCTLLAGCGDEPVVENNYEPRVVINQETFFKYITDLMPEAKPRLAYDHDGVVLDLGKDIDHKKIHKADAIRVLVKYFDYNPNDERYVIRYQKKGVYGNKYANIKLTYYPQQLLFNREQSQAQINLNETWTCMYYEDLILTARNNKYSTNCYSYTGK